MSKRAGNQNRVADSDAASARVIVLSIVVLLIIACMPSWLLAQNTTGNTTEPSSVSDQSDLSGSEGEDAVQPSGSESEDAVQGSGAEAEEAVELSAGNAGEPIQLSPGEVEPAVQPSAGEEGFALPGIEVPDFGEALEESPSQEEPSVFTRRSMNEYYEGLVSLAPLPDISQLGPLPEKLEEGVEFTDVAADWIYHQKSTGMTELRGHVMIISDTTIISCDEATLDEESQVYHFYGEGRTFVDDSDFTLECDEMEIHDADEEKMIYIKGASTMVVYADEDAEEPGEDATRRQRVEYALSRQDTTITFTDAEYNYDKDIFDAHGGVRFEQSDKYAKGDEFHGEDETDYALFTGNCEFWQKDGLWLYEHKIIENQEDPPNKRDRLVRALMSVPTTITSDEAEAEGESGWLELRGSGGNVVFLRQDDKHAECETLSLWYTEEEEKPEETGQPVNLLEEPPPEEEQPEPTILPGFGALRLASEFPPDFIPWEAPVEVSAGAGEGIMPVETEPLEALPVEIESGESTQPDGSSGQDFGYTFPEGETTPQAGAAGSIAEIEQLAREMAAPESAESTAQPENELIMRGNVFFRQENGNWLFDYDVIREEEETEKDIEQYKKWANGSCDLLHVWMDDEITEASGTISGEQDNQDIACDFMRYVGDLDMLYMRGNLAVHREDKHQLMSQEGFIFFSTKVFEALGSVQTTVMVDVEERRSQAQEGEGTEEGQGGEEGEGTAQGEEQGG
jgi:hypothetical protein